MLPFYQHRLSFHLLLSSQAMDLQAGFEGDYFLPPQLCLSCTVPPEQQFTEVPRDRLVIELEIDPQLLSLHDTTQRLQRWKCLDHPNILKCYDYRQQKNIFFVTTERCALLAVDKDSPQEKIYLTLVDILKGLIYLASKSIIHRNINLHNIFLDKLGQVKIGGLGLSLRASHIPFDKIVYKERALSQCLTLSPQGFLNRLYGHKTDVWALGSLIFELYHNRPLFQTTTSEIDLINSFRAPIPDKEGMPPSVKDLMLKCLVADWKIRPTLLTLEPGFWELFINAADTKGDQHFKALMKEKISLLSGLIEDYRSVIESVSLGGIMTKNRLMWIVHYSRLLFDFLYNFNRFAFFQFSDKVYLEKWLISVIRSAKEKLLHQQFFHEGEVQVHEQKLLQSLNEYLMQFQKELKVDIEPEEPCPISDVIKILTVLNEALSARLKETSSKDHLRHGISLGIVLWATKHLQKNANNENGLTSFNLHEQFLNLQTQLKKKKQDGGVLQLSWVKYKQLQRDILKIQSTGQTIIGMAAAHGTEKKQ